MLYKEAFFTGTSGGWPFKGELPQANLYQRLIAKNFTRRLDQSDLEKLGQGMKF